MEASDIDTLVARLCGPDRDLQRAALGALESLARAAQSGTPADLEALLIRRSSLEAALESLETEERSHLSDILSALAATDDPSAALLFRLSGGATPLDLWGQQYVRCLASAIVSEHQRACDRNSPRLDFLSLVRPIIAFLFAHNAETEAIDFALELSSPLGANKATSVRTFASEIRNVLGDPEDIVRTTGRESTALHTITSDDTESLKTQRVEKQNVCVDSHHDQLCASENRSEAGIGEQEAKEHPHVSTDVLELLAEQIESGDGLNSRTLFYLEALSRFSPRIEPLLLRLTQCQYPTRHLVGLLRARRYNDALSFVRELNDPLLRRQCLYILARVTGGCSSAASSHGLGCASTSSSFTPAEVQILANEHLSPVFRSVAAALEVEQPKRLDSLLFLRGSVSRDRAEVTAVANSMIHFGFCRDPLFMPAEGDAAASGVKEEQCEFIRTSSATSVASLGLICAFDVSKVFSYVGEHAIFERPEIGAVLAVALAAMRTGDPSGSVLRLLSLFYETGGVGVSSDPSAHTMGAAAQNQGAGDSVVGTVPPSSTHHPNVSAAHNDAYVNSVNTGSSSAYNQPDSAAIMALMGTALLYTASHRQEIYELVFPLLSSNNNATALFAIYVLGAVFPGDVEILASCAEVYSELRKDPLFGNFALLGLALFFYGQDLGNDERNNTVCSNAADSRGDAGSSEHHPSATNSEAANQSSSSYCNQGNSAQLRHILHHKLPSHARVLARALAAVGSGSAAVVDALLAETFVGEIDSLLESFGLVGACIVALGDEVAVPLAERICTSSLLLDSPHLKSIVPLCLGLLYASDPRSDVVDTLERCINSGECSVSALIGLGLVGAGSCSSRIGRILDAAYSSVYRDPRASAALIYARGLLHLGKGLFTLSPAAYDGQLLLPRSVVSLLSLIWLFVETSGSALREQSALLYVVAGAVQPRYVHVDVRVDDSSNAATERHAEQQQQPKGNEVEHSDKAACDEQGKSSEISAGESLTLRVGKALDVVGLAGRPARVGAAVVQTLPAILNARERAESDMPLYTDYVEDIIVFKKSS